MTLEEWTENYPESPLGVLANLLQEFRSGERDQQALEASLAIFDEFLQEWAQAIQASDSPDQDLQGQVSDGLLKALQGLADAAALLREYGEFGEEEIAENAMAEAREAQELLLEMLEISQEPF